MTTGADLDVDAIAAAGLAAWPEVTVDAAAFRAHVAGLAGQAPDGASSALATHAAELCLAFACARGEPRALDALDRDYLVHVRAPLARMGLGAAQIDEAMQAVRHELLLPRETLPPRIAGYGGRGPLRAWLRAVAARTALRIRDVRANDHEPSDDDLEAQSGDLELAYMKKTYGAAFHRAFRAALAALPEADRVLLKQRFRHHLTLDELGAMHAVHLSTMHRRIAAAREQLVERTRDAMMAELGVDRGDVSSILRMIYSEVDITLGTLNDG